MAHYHLTAAAEHLKGLHDEFEAHPDNWAKYLELIGEAEARAIFTTLGMSDDEVGLLIAIGDYEYAVVRQNRHIEIVGDAYVRRAMDRTQAVQQLGTLNLPAAQQALLLSEWDTERTFRSKRLTEAQMRKAYGEKIVGLDEYQEHMRGLGYPERDIQILTAMMTG